MKQSKHTPEPWGVEHSGEGYPMIHGSEATDPVTEARYHWVSTLMPCPSNLYKGGKHRETDGIAEREANASRIVSCVNALAGLDPAKLAELLAAAEQALQDEKCLRDGERAGADGRIVEQDSDCPEYDDERAGPTAWCWVCRLRTALRAVGKPDAVE